jgi:hypothetical protein
MFEMLLLLNRWNMLRPLDSKSLFSHYDDKEVTELTS